MRYITAIFLFLAPIVAVSQPISATQAEDDAAYLIEEELRGYYSTQSIEVNDTSHKSAEVKISVVRNSKPLSKSDNRICQMKGSPYHFLLCQPTGHEFSEVLFLNYVDTRQGRVLEVPIRLRKYPFDANLRIPENQQPGYVTWPTQSN